MMRVGRANLEGLLLIDKPQGISSAQAVDRVKRALPRGTKVGHAGALDPFATGLLIVLVGSATRQCESIMGLPKTYLATIRLGATTATDDRESPEQPFRPAEAVTPAPPTIQRVQSVLREFVGLIRQVPPVYSAIKLGGKRACDRVRQGQNVQLSPRSVRVDSIEVLNYQWPELRVLIRCGRGTYIRALARDIGRQLGVGGYLLELRRTRIGEHDVSSAVALDAPGCDLAGRIIPVGFTPDRPAPAPRG